MALLQDPPHGKDGTTARASRRVHSGRHGKEPIDSKPRTERRPKEKAQTRKKEQKGNKEGEKQKDKAFEFPDYDFASSSASASSSSQKQQMEEEVRKEVLKCLKASGVEPTESLAELLKVDPEPLSNLNRSRRL